MEENKESKEAIETNFLCCEKCNCTNIGLVKKGFSGKSAIIGFLVGSVIGGDYYSPGL
jgi:hypothetical protein